MQEQQLTSMNKEELQELAKNIDKELDAREKKRIQDAQAEVRRIAKEAGLSVEELLGGKSGPRSKAPPKFANPNDKSQTWTGRGKQPNWFKEQIAAGKSRDEMLIK